MAPTPWASAPPRATSARHLELKSSIYKAAFVVPRALRHLPQEGVLATHHGALEAYGAMLCYAMLARCGSRSARRRRSCWPPSTKSA